MKLYSAQFVVLYMNYDGTHQFPLYGMKCIAHTMKELRAMIKSVSRRYEKEEMPYWCFIGDYEL